MCRRYKILICAFTLLFWALPAVAQVEYDGFTMGLGGTIGAGYNGDLSQAAGGSDHSLGLSGVGELAGSFYNPNFISFSAQPYYNRSQANSGGGSIFDSSGYTGNINIFTGSHFPGNVSFSQGFDSTGFYGIPGVSGLTTKNNSRTFGIGWSALLPDLPSLTVSYARGSGSSSVLGSDAQGDTTTNSFTVRSGYRLAGLSLGTSFIHQTIDSSSIGFLGGGETETNNTSSNTFQINASRGFHNGGFGLGYSRSEYSNAYSAGVGGSSSGTTDNLFGNVGFQVWKLPLSATVAYTDNLYGSLEEQLLSNGQTYVQASISPESRSLVMNLSTSHTILPHVFATAFVSRQEEYLGGTSFGLTQFGANVSGNFGERFKGLTATVGVVDSANQEGNEGASLLANVNYRRNIGRWELEGNFGYDQSVQTLLAIYQTSSLNYGGSVRRRLLGRLNWSLGGGGGHSGFVQVAGDSSHAETITSSLSGYGYAVAVNYSKSDGTSVLTPTGLVPVPVPVVSNNLVLFNATGKGLTMTAVPIHNLQLSGVYSQANSTTVSLFGSGLSSGNRTEYLSGTMIYQFRKMYFNAGVLRFKQDIGAAGVPPSVVTSYYFGISRWFKAF